MAKITVDARMINFSGIGTYIRCLLPVVMSELPAVDFVIVGNADELRQYNWSLQKNVSIVHCILPIYSISEQVGMSIPKDTTLFWSPHYNIPLKYYGGKLLVTVHDVFHLAMPQFVGGLHKRMYAKFMFNALRYKADAIMCDSQFTARELARYTGINKKVYTIYLGIETTWFREKDASSPCSRPYLLFVGNVKPHKNLMRLLQALKIIEHAIPHDLLIVGKKEGFITGDLKVLKEAENFGGRVKFTGQVDDFTLRQYYAHADALVFPSLYEGFGLPPLEAMACGCPVVASPIEPIQEVCGNAVLYCNPYDPADIAEKIERMVKDPSLRSELIAKGKQRVEKYSWKESGKQVANVIKEVLAR
ncbi:glycosyl transferases group 1 [Lucifera butyrica]|uniref:Glycosyl transferases group 1 n=1 Tax=Lucifera butyrica TaxID=1351585 RepID=A0A498R9D2_9FIRM|nr:glycosyltransferase family 1 protein [Lucifera butyrica]VBB09316.1 glycosyl transferases group 1 [Lucifera butyrica]